MHEAVSDILDLRTRESQGLPRMIVVSMVAHAALLAMVVLVPADWQSQPKPKVNPMFISLGGAIGPNAGGMTQLSGRSVQAVAPVEPKARVEPPPAPKAPEMALPDAKPTRTRANPK